MLLFKEKIFKNDLASSNLRRAVKSVKEIKYKAKEKQGGVLKEARKIYESGLEIYNKKGMLVEWQLSFPKDKLPAKGLLKYNENGEVKCELVTGHKCGSFGRVHHS